jgi:hypothetical protein
MKVSRIIVGMIVCALSSQLAWGQEASPARTRGALGYFDYSTGAFRLVGPMTEDFNSDSLAATTPQTGTVTVNFTITIKSVIPANYLISCGVSAIVTEVSIAGVNIISEDAAVAATRTGSTAKCTVTIPYSWALLNPSTARLSLNYTLGASKATAATGLLSRLSLGTIANIAAPASGSTTTQTVNAVL